MTTPAPPLNITVPFTRQSSCEIVTAREGQAEAPLIVALHGQGESGERHRHYLRGAIPAHFHAAFPDGFHAHEVRKPDRPIRLGYGWYLYTGDQDAFLESVALAEEALWRLIDRVLDTTGADASRVYLMGFSQGCYLAQMTAVRHAERVAGWIGQAGRLKDEVLTDELPRVAGKPVLLQHGEDDEAIGADAARHGAEVLTAHGAEVSLKLYKDTGHHITDTMRGDMRAWLAER